MFLLLLLRWFLTSEGPVLGFEQSLATSQREICPGQDKPCHFLKIQSELVTLKSRFTSAQHQFSQGDRCSLSHSVSSGSWFLSVLCITVLEILPVASKIALYSISACALKWLYKYRDLFSMLRLTAAPGHASGCQDAASRQPPGKLGLLVPSASQVQLVYCAEFKHKGYGTMTQNLFFCFLFIPKS